MMIQTDDKRNQQDYALAQLLVHAPRNSAGENNGGNYGEEATTEELAMLAEGKLDAARREQILNQLNDNTALYETWMMLQEFTQCDPALALQKNDQESSQEEADPTPTIQRQVQKPPTLVEKITEWFSELFSWQGAFATSFGIALGAVFMMQAGIDDGTGYEADLKHGIAIHAPMEAPQKASIDKVDVLQNATKQLSSSEISHVEIVSVESSTVHFRVTLVNGEELLDSYEINLNQNSSESNE